MTRILTAIVAVGVVALVGGGLLLDTPKVKGALRRVVYGRPAPELPGHWNPVQIRTASSISDHDREERIRKLLSLGYSGTSHHVGADAGVIILDEERAAPGLRFFVSGHAPEAVLMERDGRIVHTWTYDYNDLWRSRPVDFLPPVSATGCWRRAHLMDDGSLLAVYEGHGLVKLDRDSNVLWAYAGKCHHDLDIGPDGSIVVLTRDARVEPRFHPEEPVLLDSVTFLDSEGRLQLRIDLLNAFEHSPFADLLPKAPASGDLFHTNTLELLDGRLAERSEAFRAGNVLISVRELDLLAVLDPRFGRIVWARRGPWSRQHEPTILANGHMLLFDNLGQGGRSRVLEFDPFTLETVWTYADGPETPLYSPTCGAARRLPGGNTLIVESDNGRAFEVTPDGEVVWEFVNPYRGGSGRGAHRCGHGYGSLVRRHASGLAFFRTDKGFPALKPGFADVHQHQKAGRNACSVRL